MGTQSINQPNSSAKNVKDDADDRHFSYDNEIERSAVLTSVKQGVMCVCVCVSVHDAYVGSVVSNNDNEVRVNSKIDLLEPIFIFLILSIYYKKL